MTHIGGDDVLLTPGGLRLETHAGCGCGWSYWRVFDGVARGYDWRARRAWCRVAASGRQSIDSGGQDGAK